MENEAQQASPQAKNKVLPITIVVVVVVVILVGAIAFSMSREPQPTAPEAIVNEPSPTISSTVLSAATYKDGTYKAVGEYTSPGGAESLDVTLTLKDGVVEDASVVSNAFRPTSKQMQASFIGGFKEQVIGKKIDELKLTKVSASSLAPKGFNDAVEKIKAEAKS